MIWVNLKKEYLINTYDWEKRPKSFYEKYSLMPIK